MRRKQVGKIQRCLKHSFIKMFVGPEGNKDENVKIFFFYYAVSIGLKKNINYMAFFEMIHKDKQQ